MLLGGASVVSNLPLAFKEAREVTQCADCGLACNLGDCTKCGQEFLCPVRKAADLANGGASAAAPAHGGGSEQGGSATKSGGVTNK